MSRLPPTPISSPFTSLLPPLALTDRRLQQVVLRLNGTDASGRPLTATIAETPARGSLHRLERAFDASHAAPGMTVFSNTISSSPLAAGDVVGLEEDLVFVPPPPSAVIDGTHGVVGLPFTNFTYTVATDDDDRDASSPTTPAVVRLYVGRVNDSPYLTVPTSLTARLQDYQVADVDAWETNGQLQVTLAANTLIEAARPSVLTLGGDADRSELRFGSPSGYGDGTADQEMRFTAAVEASSRAVEVSREKCRGCRRVVAVAVAAGASVGALAAFTSRTRCRL